MGVLGQNGSNLGAKRNKEVRDCFEFSFNLGCHGNYRRKSRTVPASVPWAARRWL